jgi:CDP-4-dehydro-6-deoxyglucose reductase
MAWKWYDSKVVQIEDASPTTKRFWVEADETIDFEPGQFVTMDLPISDKRLKRWRSYSIANSPSDNKHLEFCIVHLEGGAASEYFFNEVDVDTPIRFKGPSGTFTLPKSIENDLVFICTGTGVAPFRSMIHEIIQKDIPHKKIHLIFGTRYENGILYRDEFEKIAKNHNWFTYDVALSRDKSWEGYQGYVHDIYMQMYQDDPHNRDFYLCGWSAMIDEAVENLLIKMKVDKSKVHYELYG